VKEQEYPHKRIHLGTWLEDVYDDLHKMKVKGWGGKMNREEWRRIVQEAKAHPVL
jgi:hypothetical protein